MKYYTSTQGSIIGILCGGFYTQTRKESKQTKEEENVMNTIIYLTI